MFFTQTEKPETSCPVYHTEYKSSLLNASSLIVDKIQEEFPQYKDKLSLRDLAGIWKLRKDAGNIEMPPGTPLDSIFYQLLHVK